MLETLTVKAAAGVVRCDIFMSENGKVAVGEVKLGG